MTKVKPEWKHYRVIHSIYPPENLFDSVSDKDSFLLAELESETNDRLMRWREYVHPEDARFGNGWGAVMASFCYVRAGRFNTENFGCYYASNSIHTAIAEWSYHAARTWLEFNYHEDANAIVRSYAGKCRESLVDVRSNTQVHQKANYRHSQALAQKHVAMNEFGVLYKSVRHHEGLCIGLYRPTATSPVTQASHYTIKWDGQSFTQFAEMKEFQPI